MGALELILIAGIAWVAILGLLVSMAAVASRSDREYDGLVGLGATRTSPPRGPRGFARRGRTAAHSGVKLSA